MKCTIAGELVEVNIHHVTFDTSFDGSPSDGWHWVTLWEFPGDGPDGMEFGETPVTSMINAEIAARKALTR